MTKHTPRYVRCVRELYREILQFNCGIEANCLVNIHAKKDKYFILSERGQKVAYMSTDIATIFDVPRSRVVAAARLHCGTDPRTTTIRRRIQRQAFPLKDYDIRTWYKEHTNVRI